MASAKSPSRRDLRLTPEQDLNAAAALSDTDAAAAARGWRAHAPVEFRLLLDAEPVKEQGDA